MNRKLDNNKRICALAWTHLHITTTGKVAPCGQYALRDNPEFELKNIIDHSLEECINGPGMKYIRSSMLQDIPNELCSLCEYKMHKNIKSTKDRANEIYLEQTKEAMAKTNLDGSINMEDFKPVFLDVRFGNLCNLKCRMCSWDASSAWFSELMKIPKLDASQLDLGEITVDASKFINNGAYEKIKHLLIYSEKIYFAGGEPLLMEDHYRILTHLIETDRAKDIELHYSTNYTISKYKNTLLADYWKHFKQVIVAGSVDGIEEVSDYIRTGSTWEKIKQVVTELKPEGYEYRNISLSPCVTISLMNIFHMGRFFKWCFENNWLTQNQQIIAINYVEHPADLSIKRLPAGAKQQITTMLNELSDWLIETESPDSCPAINEIATFMNGYTATEEELKQSLIKAKRRLDVYDKSGDLDWKTTLPELAKIMVDIA
jgi:radical SAM protein with 4Fe4S-binding SPASM domain